MLTKKNSETMINVFLLIVGIILFISAQGIETGAAMSQGGDFMPKLLSVFWVICAIAMVATDLMKRKKSHDIKSEEKETSNGNFMGFIITFLLLFTYIIFLKKIGFVIMSGFYLFCQMFLFTPKEKRNYIFMIIFSIVFPVAVNYLFSNVFSLILPAGLLK